jgi:hypothetical protein
MEDMTTGRNPTDPHEATPHIRQLLKEMVQGGSAA